MIRKNPRKEGFFVQAGATGIEPAISALTGPHVSHYTTPPNGKSLPQQKYNVKINHLKK
jgi:hypothetical protein